MFVWRSLGSVGHFTMISRQVMHSCHAAKIIIILHYVNSKNFFNQFVFLLCKKFFFYIPFLGPLIYFNWKRIRKVCPDGGLTLQNRVRSNNSFFAVFILPLSISVDQNQCLLVVRRFCLEVSKRGVLLTPVACLPGKTQGRLFKRGLF